MIVNNNLFRIKKEEDILEIVEDNKDKISIVLFVEEIKNVEKILEICNDKDVIVLIVEIDNYEPNGMISIDKIPGYIMFNKVIPDDKKVNELNEKINLII